MNPGKKNRRDYLSLNAIEPHDGTLTCEIQISYDRLQYISKRGKGHAMECAYILPAILCAPTAIFEGLRNDEDEDHQGYGWRCYCGIPVQAYRVDGTLRTPYPNQVYLIFVNDEHVAYNWRWEKADPNDSRLPIDHKIRFRKQLL